VSAQGTKHRNKSVVFEPKSSLYNTEHQQKTVPSSPPDPRPRERTGGTRGGEEGTGLEEEQETAKETTQLNTPTRQASATREASRRAVHIHTNTTRELGWRHGQKAGGVVGSVHTFSVAILTPLLLQERNECGSCYTWRRVGGQISTDDDRSPSLVDPLPHPRPCTSTRTHTLPTKQPNNRWPLLSPCRHCSSSSSHLLRVVETRDKLVCVRFVGFEVELVASI
jgi:hypothetical protein